MSLQFIRISELPDYLPTGYDRAVLYHRNRYRQWLSRAGASPRVAVALCPSTDVLEEAMAYFRSESLIVVHEEARSNRPIPQSILKHQGDHFNRTLFVVSLEQESEKGESLLSQLDRYVDHYAKVATWVLFVITSAHQLKNFAKLAPQLWSRVERCVPLGGQGVGTAPEFEMTNSPRLNYACSILSGLSGNLPPSYHDWSRFLRTGFGHTTFNQEFGQAVEAQDRWRFANVSGHVESNSDPVQRPLTMTEEYVQRNRNKGQHPWVKPNSTTPEDRFLISQLTLLHRNLESGTMPELDFVATFRESYAHRTSPDLGVEACLVDAQLYAQDQNVEEVEQAICRAVAISKNGSLEAQFEAQARQVELYLLLESFSDARRSLSELEVLEPSLMSPFYQARTLALKGNLIGSLDPGKGAELTSEAQELFRHHGYLSFVDDQPPEARRSS